MIEPMPKELLIHTVEYEEYTERDRYGNEFKEPVTLEHVLVQPVSNISRSATADQVAFSSLLFFDCVHSRPSDVEFVKNSRITFNGKSMTVNKINPIYTFDLHHYELELI
jgi:hypothetical protein